MGWWWFLFVASHATAWRFGGVIPAAWNWSSIEAKNVVVEERRLTTPCGGRTALITGGSRGLGKHISIALAEAGFRKESETTPAAPGGVTHFNTPIAHIICVSRSLAGCEETAQFINQKFPGKDVRCPRAKAYSVDVANGADVKVLVQRILQQYKSIDILVNNAGITKDKLLLQMSVDDWKNVIGANLNSVFYFSKAVLRGMVASKWGRIINIASVSGIGGNAGQANYASSKAGVIGFTKSLAKEVGSANITVNAVAPGFIESDMTKKLRPSVRDSSVKQVPAARFGTPSEVADVVAFLASDDASYVSGAVMVVDGGLMFGMA